MMIVFVHIQVKPEFVTEFVAATLTNCAASRQEPGIFRFELLANQDDRCRFVLIEGYRTAEAPAAHKETSHYQIWKETVAPFMAEPRQSVKYTPIEAN